MEPNTYTHNWDRFQVKFDAYIAESASHWANILSIQKVRDCLHDVLTTVGRIHLLFGQGVRSFI